MEKLAVQQDSIPAGAVFLKNVMPTIQPAQTTPTDQQETNGDTSEVICRTCLKTTPNASGMLPMKSFIGNQGTSLLEALLFCLNYGENDEDFPQQMCYQCAGELFVAYNFVVKARASHETYHQQLPDAPVYIVTYGDEDAITKAEENESNNSAEVVDVVVESPPIPSTNHIPETSEASTSSSGLKRSKPASKTTSTAKKQIIEEVIDVDADSKILQRCEVCNKSFDDEELWEEHVSSMHILDCEFCKIGFKSTAEKISHYTINHKCGYCKMVFRKRQDLIKHKRLHMRKCIKCWKMFIWKGNNTSGSFLNYTCQECLEMPVEGQGKPPPVFKCVNCGMPFNNRREFQEHRKKHGSVPCPDCDLLFEKRGAEMNKHAQQHKRIYIGCDHCETSFTDMASYHLHLRIVHICYACKKVLKSESELNLHFIEHKSYTSYMDHFQNGYRQCSLFELPTKCPYCQTGFDEASQLYDHLRSAHPKAQLNFGFHCHICGINYRALEQDNVEVKHIHDWKIKCFLCLKPYNNLNDLFTHLDYHNRKTRNVKSH